MVKTKLNSNPNSNGKSSIQETIKKFNNSPKLPVTKRDKNF